MAGPVFRADHVGSLLRPSEIKRARAEPGAVTLTQAGYRSSPELVAVENETIRAAVNLQERAGLPVVTDGEFRRSFWHLDFLGALQGLDLEERAPETGAQFAGVKMRPVFPTISGPIDFPDDHPMLGHFEYLASVTGVTPKISIPGPSACHYRTAASDIRYAPYADPDVFFADVARTYNKAVHAFYRAGCRYLQLDDIFFAYLCDERQRAEKAAAGQDPDWLIERYAWMMREAIYDRPDDMTVAMHLCRGNFQSTWAAEGGYDPAADAVFNQTGVDVFYMEYDTERAGGLAPLRLLSKGKQRVMTGFVTTKRGSLERMDAILSLYDEAQRYVDLDQLGIAPQCGFASTEEGNALNHDEQQKKLELIVQIAHRLWGGVV